jgi:transcription initiation factor IIE alpha subunit
MIHNVAISKKDVNTMIHIDFNLVPMLSIKSTEILRLLETWRIQEIVVYRTQREYQSGGFGDPDKHPHVWAVAIMVDGQWARVHNARGQGREWSNLDRLEKWLREQGVSRWYLVNEIDVTAHLKPSDEI